MKTALKVLGIVSVSVAGLGILGLLGEPAGSDVLPGLLIGALMIGHGIVSIVSVKRMA
jgi:hypothetical protein